MISILISTHRRPHLLKRAIASAVSQKLEEHTGLEVVVVDDDPSSLALAAIAEVLPIPEKVSFKYIKRAEGLNGTANARNSALRAAEGEWVLFLDDDDCLLPGSVEKMLFAAKKNEAHFCAGNFLTIKENADGIPKSEYRSDVKWHSYEQLLLGNIFPVGSYIIQRNAISVPFNPSLKTHEDWLFLLDNLKRLRVCTIDSNVLAIHQSEDASREHRNRYGGNLQVGSDWARIYSLHPAPQFAEARKEILEIFQCTDLQRLIGGDGF